MKQISLRSAIYLSLTAILAVLTVSCQPLQKGLDAEDDKNPYFRRAIRFTHEQNFHGAISEYENALRANPEVAKAHVEMGLLYLDKLGDPISAIFHFQKFLSIRPNDSMHEQLQTYIDKAKIDFAITLPNSTAQTADEFARLKQENTDLRQALAKTQSALANSHDSLSKATLSPNSTATPTVPDLSPVPIAEEIVSSVAPQAEAIVDSVQDDVSFPSISPPRAIPITPETGERSHVIASGDSLWKIAKTYYPDNVSEGIKKIQTANPNKAADPSKLKLGAELIIP